jgi:hypothetical protein
METVWSSQKLSPVYIGKTREGDFEDVKRELLVAVNMFQMLILRYSHELYNISNRNIIK